MGEQRRKEEIKEREDKAFKTFEAYIRSIVAYDSSTGPENESRLLIMRDKMRELIFNGVVNDSDDGK